MVTKNDLYIDLFLADKRYHIDSFGVITSFVSKQGHLTKIKRVCKLTQGVYGHLSFDYGPKNKRKVLQVHRIVYRKYIGPLNSQLCVNHKDGNPKNNHYSNLELVSLAENSQHSFKVLKRPAVIGHSKINKEIANKIRIEYLTVPSYKKLALKYNLSKTSVAYIITKKTWKL